MLEADKTKEYENIPISRLSTKKTIEETESKVSSDDIHDDSHTELVHYHKLYDDINNWLNNGIIALAISGLYSIVLVILRTPQLSQFFTNKAIFNTALIVHVNLSVVVWLVSVTCFFWHHSNHKTGFEKIFFRSAFAGMLMIAFSPLVSNGTPVMNNYVPMLESLSFVVGLSLFGVAILGSAIATIYNSIYDLIYDSKTLKFHTFIIFKICSAMILILAWLCFILSYLELKQIFNLVDIEIDFYYELLYWSGGHLLQFLYTQTLMFALLLLTEIWVNGNLKLWLAYRFLFILNFFLGIILFYGHYNYDLSDGAFKEFFTLHMKYLGGIAPISFIICLLYEIIITHKKKVMKFIPLTIFSSLLLFGFGGIVGIIISGINVTIPAHYHGSIVGISVALMGITYLYYYQKDIKSLSTIVNSDKFEPFSARKLDPIDNRQAASNDICQFKSIDYNMLANVFFPNVSYENITHYIEDKLPLWQIYIFTIGQMLHILGLALAGGYGVMRKSPNDEIAFSVKIYMGMVGIGGLLAIIGGLMFVYICAKKLYQQE